MAKINIDIKRVRSANYNLPSIISNYSEQKRNISMLKWRIISDIQDRRYIRGRLGSILQEMDRIEQQLDDLYKVTGSAVTQYMKMEDKLTSNASMFL